MTHTPERDGQVRRKLPWYATSPRESKMAPWFVWCGLLSAVGGILAVLFGDAPLWRGQFGVAMLAIALLAWVE